MRFAVDYSKENANLSSRTSEERMQATYELLKYYILNFEDEKLSFFLQTIGYFNVVAKEKGCVFVYELDEVEKTGNFMLASETFPLEKDSYFVQGLQLATEHFRDVTIRSECGLVTVRGVADLS